MYLEVMLEMRERRGTAPDVYMVISGLCKRFGESKRSTAGRRLSETLVEVSL
jgi:hypothetical protein